MRSKNFKCLNENKRTTLKELKMWVDDMYKRFGGKAEVSIAGDEYNTVDYLSVSFFTPEGEYFCSDYDLEDGDGPNTDLGDGYRLRDLTPVIDIWPTES